MLFATPMFGCVSTHSTTRASRAPTAGYSPAPPCVYAATRRFALRAPVVRVVAVQVESADAVLVVAAVAVVVDAFGEHHVVAVPRADVAHEAAALVGRVDDRVALSGADELPHLADEAVAVEVLAGILVEQPVAVVVLRAHGAAVRLRR